MIHGIGAGKGGLPRKVDLGAYGNNYDQIFKSGPNNCETQKGKIANDVEHEAALAQVDGMLRQLDDLATTIEAYEKVHFPIEPPTEEEAKAFRRMQESPLDPKGEAGSRKAPMWLIPPSSMQQTAWVHKLGAEKYGAFNWRETGVCATTYISAIMRHLNAWRDGEDLDPESGISHLAHIACSCNILMDASHCNRMQDDRNRIPEQL
jgi:hypothetical protein